jgi:hypothetical protein
MIAAWNVFSHNDWGSPEVIPSSAGAELFRTVDVFQSKNAIYKSSSGKQINIRGMPGRAAPTIKRPTQQVAQFRAIHAQATSLTRAIQYGVQVRA